MQKIIAKHIFETILKSENIVLIPHQNPDGDALGSSGAMALWLESIGKSYTLYCKTAVSPRLTHLRLKKISQDPKIWESKPDLVIVFDSGDLFYAGVATEVLAIRDKITLINIDHHASNELYGDLNFVDTKSSSTSEMIERFFLANSIPVSKEMATSLLTGFVTDTDNFTNAATSSFALNSAGHLLNHGGTMAPTQQKIYKNISIPALKVWGVILDRITKNEKLDIIYTYTTKQDLKDANIEESDLEGVANFMQSIKEGKIKMILKEKEPGLWKGSFRTIHDDVDVSVYALAFNGGGHKKAAGFTVEGTIEEALEKIFSFIENKQK
jgi:phosphoesterase RecJ-like protein